MKINLRVLCQRDAVAALARDRTMATSSDLDAVVFELDSDNPLFDRFLELTTSTSGCWLNPVMTFSPAEMAAARHFQLEGRKLVREGPGDYEVNIARLRALPFIKTGPFRIRLLDAVSLSRASLKPTEVACAADWMAEFIVSRAVGNIFKTEGLRGFSLRPVLAPKSGKQHEEVTLLYTTHLMPLATLDLTTPVFEDRGEEGGHRQLACLAYDFGTSLRPESDFCRTAENWSSNHMPVWVVSARVREVFLRHKLRGWAFRPVMETGTALYAAYRDKWQVLMGRVAACNPRHHF